MHLTASSRTARVVECVVQIKPPAFALLIVASENRLEKSVPVMLVAECKSVPEHILLFANADAKFHFLDEKSGKKLK